MPETETEIVVVERGDTLATEIVALTELHADDYVLLPEDLDEPDVPLVVDDDYQLPVLVRVVGFEHDPDECVVFDGPFDEYARIDTTPAEQVRRVLPGQDHRKWKYEE